MKSESKNSYDHLTFNEVETLASGYKNSTTRMIEVIAVRKKSALMMDLHKDIEFSHVIFPASILPLLKKHDTFLATFGLKNEKWEIINLSRPYESWL